MKRRLVLVGILLLLAVYLALSYQLGITGKKLYDAVTAIESDCMQYKGYMSDALLHANSNKKSYEENLALVGETIDILAYKFGLDSRRLKSLAIRETEFNSIPEDPGNLGCGFFAVLRYMSVQVKATESSSQYLDEWGKLISLNHSLLSLAEKDVFNESEFRDAVVRAYQTNP